MVSVRFILWVVRMSVCNDGVMWLNTYMDRAVFFWNEGYYRGQQLRIKWEFVSAHRKGDLEIGCWTLLVSGFASSRSAIQALAELLFYVTCYTHKHACCCFDLGNLLH